MTKKFIISLKILIVIFFFPIGKLYTLLLSQTFTWALLIMLIMALGSCNLLPPTSQGAKATGDTVSYRFLTVDRLPRLEVMPSLFQKPDGTMMKDMTEWDGQRDYIKAMLAHYQYGRMPPSPDFIIEPIATDTILNGTVIEELFYMVLENKGKSVKFKVGIRRPNKEGRFPVIIKNDRYIFDLTDIPDKDKREHYKEVGRDRIERSVTIEANQRGYIICKFIRDQVASDTRDSRDTGVYNLYPGYDWGTIAIWAWAYQPIIDYLEEKKYVDKEKIVATGHSRGGKTALCAGIYDERIAITAPNSSGSGGTGGWRYFDPVQKHQTLSGAGKRFPYWWSDNLFQFTGQVEKLPFGAHFAKAAIAPRALVNMHARHDFWANPYGTYLTYLAAQPIFDSLGVSQNQGIHWRDGGHNQNEEDWQALFDYCDLIFFGKTTGRHYDQNPHPHYRYDSLLIQDNF